MDKTLSLRRRALELLFERFGDAEDVQLTPFTHDVRKARSWLRGRTGALDGVVAKRLELPYPPGERAMLR